MPVAVWAWSVGRCWILRWKKPPPDVADLEQMFSLKTGALIHSSVMLGAHCAQIEPAVSMLQNLDAFGQAIGLCFQVQDDILDVIGDTEVIGKPQGSDEEKGKPNYAIRYGLENAKQRAESLFATAVASLDEYGEQAEPLRYMGAYITRRNY